MGKRKGGGERGRQGESEKGEGGREGGRREGRKRQRDSEGG